MDKVHKFTVAAGFTFALALTFSCSSDNEGDNDDVGKGNDISNYRTVNIGGQVWMAENLNYNVAGSKCYDDKSANCKKYGRLYDWETANRVCPEGWHLPTEEEWKILTNFIEEDKSCYSCEAEHLKAQSDWDSWDYSGNGKDTYGFAALPGGYGSHYSNSYSFSNIGLNSMWWTATEINTSSASSRQYDYNHNGGGAGWASADKSYMYSVRCLQD